VTRRAPVLPTLLACTLLVAAFSAAVAAVTLDLSVWTREDARRLSLERSPVALSPVEMMGHDRRGLAPWSKDRAVAKVYLVDFIYTRCPSLCIALGSAFRRTQEAIVSRGLASKVALLSISFDAERDTIDNAAQYARAHGAAAGVWWVAIPDAGALARLLQEAGVVVIPDGAGGYAHNGGIHVIDAQGRLLRVFDVEQYEAALDFAAGRLGGS
jgi:protein SCO1